MIPELSWGCGNCTERVAQNYSREGAVKYAQTFQIPKASIVCTEVLKHEPLHLTHLHRKWLSGYECSMIELQVRS